MNLFYFALILSAFSLLTTLLFYIACSTIDADGYKTIFRSCIICTTSFVNALLLAAIVGHWCAALPALCCSLAIIKKISTHRFFHVMISYFNFILPLSSIVIMPGVVLFLFTLLLHPFCFFKLNFTKIKSLTFEWRYANFLTHGGIIKIKSGYSGFNMGCCTFVNQHDATLNKHEYGHQLNLAVLGGWFHYIGAIDENYIQANPSKAYAELVADSIGHPSNFEHSIWSI